MLERIRQLREEAALSQREIAAILNCTQQAYSNYETGIRELPLGLLVDIAVYYHVSVDYLLGLAETKQGYYRQ